MKSPLVATLAGIALCCSPLALAQPPATTDAAEVKAIQAKSRTPADKKAFVGAELALTPAEASRFWPAYDAFQRRLDANNRRFALALQEAIVPEQVSDRHARNLAKELTEIEDAETRARKTLYAAVVRALPGRKAIRYLQLEAKLQAGYRYDVANSVPLVK